MQRAFSSCSKFKPVTHCIFDLDGLILNTEKFYQLARENVVNKFGKEYDHSLDAELKGKLGTDIAEELIKVYELPVTVEELLKLLKEQYAYLMPNAQPMPDTEGIYQKAISDVAKMFGKVFTTEIRNKLVGTTVYDTASIAIREMKLPISQDEFIKRFRKFAYTSPAMANVPFLPGAKRLLTHLHQNKVPMAVATSSSIDSYEIKTKKHLEIFALFNHIVCGGSDPEVKKGKPNPDIFLVCASRFPEKPPSEKCLVFEDAPNGVKAAVAANMQVVMVPDASIPEESKKDATLVLDSLEDLKPELFGLPPFK